MPAAWIDASRPPVVPGTKVHAIAVTPLLLYVVWWSWTTFLILVVVSIVMGYMQLKGRQPAWVLQRTKCRLRGGHVHARPLWYRRRRTRIESYADLDVHEAYCPGRQSAKSSEERALIGSIQSREAPRAGATVRTKETAK